MKALNYMEFVFEDHQGKVLIIVKDLDRFCLISEFLKSKKWNTLITSSLKDAIVSISNEKPDFVFASFNHTNPLIFELPQWVNPELNIDFIAFAETINANILNQIHNNHFFPFKMNKNPSGPTLLLMLRRILYQRHVEFKETDGKNLIYPLTHKRSESFQNRSKLKDNETHGNHHTKQPTSPHEAHITSSDELSLQKAMNNAFQNLPIPEGRVTGDLNHTNSFEIIPIYTDDKTGYVVFSTNLDKSRKQNGFSDFKSELKKISDNGSLSFLMSENYFVDSSKFVNFNNWTKNQGEFNFYKKEKQAEIGSTFLNVPAPLPKIFPKNEDGKIPIQIEDFPVNYPTNFSTYLHLKQQKKYLLYIKKGGMMSKHQKENLIEKNESLYIDPQDEAPFKTLYVKNSLDKMINEYQKNQNN